MAVKKKKSKAKTLTKKVDNVAPEDKPLTPKQKSFCLYYLQHHNATYAAELAGYSKNTAGSIGAENLKKPQIIKGLHKAMEERAKSVFVDATFVLETALRFLTVDITDFQNENGEIDAAALKNMPKELTSCIETLQIDSTRYEGDETKYIDKVKITLPNKLKTLETIGKHIDISAFVELHKHKHEGKIEHEHVQVKEAIDFEAIRGKRSELKIVNK